MKLVFCNGKHLEVRDVSEIICTIDAREETYLGVHGYHIMEDDEARALLQKLKQLGNFKTSRI